MSRRIYLVLEAELLIALILINTQGEGRFNQSINQSINKTLFIEGNTKGLDN